MASFTITIPADKVQTATNGFLKIYPNTETNGGGALKYTNAQWVKEKTRRNLIRDIRRGLQLIANESAVVVSDDEMAS